MYLTKDSRNEEAQSMQFIGAQKQVDSIHQFLNSIDAEMAQYIPVAGEVPTAAQISLATASVPTPAAPEPTAGEIIPGVGKPAVMPPSTVPEFTPEDYANIEAEPGRDIAEDVEPQDAIPVNDNPAALVPLANTLGQSGKKAMVCDYALGVLIAILKKSPKSESGGLSSNAGFIGLIRKAMILMAVWVAAEFDRSLGVDWARTTMGLFWIGNEGLSLFENSAILGFPWPDAMKDVLEAMKKQGNSGKKTVDSAGDKISDRNKK